MRLCLPALRFLGKGVAIAIHSPELVQFRQTLAKSWDEWLSQQDRQGYRPHITVQNKVSAAEAQELYEDLARKWQPVDGCGEGLLLWYYRGGPWEQVAEFSFI